MLALGADARLGALQGIEHRTQQRGLVSQLGVDDRQDAQRQARAAAACV